MPFKIIQIGAWWYVVDRNGERYAGPFASEERAQRAMPKVRAS